MSLRHALLAASCLALPLAFGLSGAVQAQPVSGLYVGAGTGINMWHDQASRGIRFHDDDIGVAGVASLGWGFGNGFRAEVEGSIRNSEIQKVVSGAGQIGSSGYLNQYGAMANLLFDFDMSSFGASPSAVRPYIGGGVGYLWSELSSIRLNTGGSAYRIDDTSGEFAYQAIVGAAWGLGSITPGLSLTTEYRYLGALDGSFNIGRTAGPANATVPGSVKLPTSNHSVLIGLRYAFNAPAPALVAAPAAPVAPEPSIARTYLVFFDWDRADLTDRARQIVAEAAAAAPRVQSTRIEVAGHADRSGTPQYNQHLSQRRADAVAAELVRHGVARTAITVTAFGESRPLVPTADGVREPQNRRVEIVLR
ncbi:OmpA family protein [Siccirubricoccus deserti]|uniref:OmpA family protein n=1 Tax=Siccirubricoccus deserti TaxID=2013562 RepID=A0A9X0UE21_9PROT|nr:OmpA family protein [Siccirubricoccus deserti]MBC4017097.1 OmpA family protein [Siccirubricoccus deserti]